MVGHGVACLRHPSNHVPLSLRMFTDHEEGRPGPMAQQCFQQLAGEFSMRPIIER